MMPGFAVSYADLDDVRFASDQTGYDPDVIRHGLVDMIPARAPYFVDTGRKFSNLMRLFMNNFIDPNNVNGTSDESAEYKRALANIYNSDYSFTSLVQYVVRQREVARENFQRINEIKNECLRNEAAGICARKMFVYQQEVDDMNLAYQIGRKIMGSTVTTLLATQVRNANTLMTKAYQNFLANSRSGVGGKTFLEPYMLHRFEPSNFHCWWNPNKTESNCPTFDSSFARIRFVTSKSDTKSSSQTSSTTFGGQVGVTIPSVPMISIGPGVSFSSEKGSARATSANSQTAVEFEVAQVKVYRPWLDPNVFEYNPLGIINTPKHFWSDGNFGGICPWYITKLIVAKNIFVSFSETNTAFESAYSASTVDVSMRVSVGPFKVKGGSASGGMGIGVSNTVGSSTEDSSYDARSKTLRVRGPQIIGYVTSRIPGFYYAFLSIFKCLLFCLAFPTYDGTQVVDLTAPSASTTTNAATRST